MKGAINTFECLLAGRIADNDAVPLEELLIKELLVCLESVAQG